MNEIKLICPTCGSVIADAEAGVAVECPSCHLTVEPMETTRLPAKPKPVGREGAKQEQVEPEDAPLLHEKDTGPLQAVLLAGGWVLVLLGIAGMVAQMLQMGLGRITGIRSDILWIIILFVFFGGMLMLIARNLLKRNSESS